jgi:site-specific DNA-methyltransferase (adenine-specific)
VNTLAIDVLAANARPRRRYGASLQYVFVLSKGRPKVFDPIKDIANQHAGQKKRFYNRLPDGTQVFRRDHLIPTHRMRSAIWDYDTGRQHSSTDPDAFKHPALMPEQLAADLILSWSTDGDVVLDPMCGSGTTAKMALLNNRRYLGFEIHQAYYDLAVKRLERATEKYVAA